MDTGAVKYEAGRQRGRTGTRTVRKSFPAASAALTESDRDLLKTTLEARDEWIETTINFDYVHEDMLIDYYTYKMKACEARYTYFLKLVKEKGLARYL